MNKIEAWFRIIRPPIVFMSTFGASVGALNASVYLGAAIDPISFALLLISAGMLAAGLMVHNDYTDLASDMVNRPHKAIPCGAIKARTAKHVGIWLMVGSVVVAFFTTIPTASTPTAPPYGLNPFCGLLTLVIVITGIYYNREGKGAGLIGHTIVAFGVGAIPYWGSIALYPTAPLVILPLAIAIFMQEIGREIMVCVGDYHGDVEAGFRTVPVRFGRRKGMAIALVFYLLFIPTFLVSAFGWFGVPRVFGDLYLIGGIIWAAVLIITWLDTYRLLATGDEQRIWDAFERDIRTITRLYIVVFQFLLLIEAFYFP